MKTNIFIPKRLNVGFQNRSDTYTGKLAYVIYYDEAGKLRKEKSWENWRNTNIPNEEFDNVPTEGFVLNKKVGDYSSGWDHRQAYCRVYDPRNFEFEITIENLLYILENTSCIKGKGLEGEFVYGWQGTDLILIPVCSPDYKAISEYTTKIEKSQSFKAKDLKEGFVYKTKEDGEYIYMGKHETFEKGYMYTDPHTNEEKVVMDYFKLPYKSGRCYDAVSHQCVWVSVKEKLWFAHRYKSHKYIGGKYVETGEISYSFEQYRNMPKKFIECDSDSCCSDYANAFEAMQNQPQFSPPDVDTIEFIPYTLDNFKKLVLGLTKERRKPCDVFRYGIFSDTRFRYDIEVNKNDTVNIELTLNSGSDLIKVNDAHYSDLRKAIDDFKQRCDRNIRTEIKEAHVYNRGLEDYRYITGPVSIEEAYNMLRPGYVKVFLKNGRFYETLLEYTV